MNDPTCSIIIATRNRKDVLLADLEAMSSAAEGLAEIIVVDNASEDGTAKAVAGRFPQVRLVELDHNCYAAARNAGADTARAPYLVMLDDDSFIDRTSLQAIPAAFDLWPNLGAFGCLVCRAERPASRGKGATTEAPSYETGGLPGVFIGCGAAIKRDLMLDLGGYPEDFGYYGEEYDLCCRLWHAGQTVVWFDDIRVTHQRAQSGRDTNRMLRFLTRNNIRLWDRYAPERRRRAVIEQTVERYGRIARNEGAMVGYEHGLREGRDWINNAGAGRQPLSEQQFRAMFGMNEAEHVLAQRARQLSLHRVALYGRGKGAEQILDCLDDLRISVPTVIDPSGAGQAWHDRTVVSLDDADRGRPEAIVVGSLSPGAVRNLAAEARRLFADLPIIECVSPLKVNAAELAGITA
ncbi:MAG TPA: glycosyltransferase [Phycisphaerae bacterium]|nr:glycosyltransferase [Phycisphaerae bacterium]